MQALLGGSVHSANMAAMVPIRTSLARWRCGHRRRVSKQKFAEVRRAKAIAKPEIFVGKVGIATFQAQWIKRRIWRAFCSRFERWGIPREACGHRSGGGRRCAKLICRWRRAAIGSATVHFRRRPYRCLAAQGTVAIG